MSDSMSLITAYQKITKEAADTKNLKSVLLRRKLREFREEVDRSRANGTDPVLIFPEEVWGMILEYVTAADDRDNASRTCQLFQRLVKDAKAELLFYKVLPIISSEFEWEQATIAKCREVCKMWRFGVDKYLEDRSLVASPSRDVVDYLRNGGDAPKGTLERSTCGFDLFVHSNPGYFPELEEEEEPDSLINPFPGGIVELTLDSETRTFDEDFEGLLEHDGNHIWHLALDGVNFNKSFPFVSELCWDSLRYCSNLRSFVVENWGCKRWSAMEIFELPLESHNQLESFTVSVKHRNFLIIQDKILLKYCHQLKRVSVQFWNTELYENLNWNRLQELEVGQENCSELLESLKQISAPKIRKLGIRLDRSAPQLENLFSVINYFSNLDHLCLRISLEFPGFSNHQINNLSPGLICSPSISTLELIAGTKEFCYDFLICFPFLKRLIIRKGSYAVREYFLRDPGSSEDSGNDEPDVNDDDDADNNSDWSNKYSSEIGSERNLDCCDDAVQREVHSKLWNATGKLVTRDLSGDLIHLSNYMPIHWPRFCQRQKSMLEFRELHKSNVWKLIPSLGKIIVHQDSSYDSIDRMVYGRELYEWRSLEETARIETHLRLVEGRLAIQKRWKRQEERNMLENRRNSVTPISDGKHPLQLFPKKNWDAILGYISDNKDILSCSRTCPFFRQFFSETKSEWLFPKMLPMIYDRLDKLDVLNCRLVCKKWKVGVDEHLDNYACTKNWNLANDDPLPCFKYAGWEKDGNPFEYKFHVGAKLPGNPEVREDMKLHPGNPFLGRSVTVITDQNNTELGSQVTSQMPLFLENFGSHIWHTRFEEWEEFFYSGEEFQCSGLSILMLQRCPNLRSLHVTDVRIDWDESIAVEEIMQNIDNSFTFPRMVHLESIRIQEKSTYTHSFILVKLLEIYRRQLKCLQLPWYPVGDGGREWPALEKFVVSAPFSDNWIEELKDLEAPNLTFLELRLDGEKAKLEELLRGIYNLSKLEKLMLKFAEEYAGFTREEVFKIMTFNPNLLAPPSLTQLEIVTIDKNVSFEFLFFFPYLKKLTIRHGKGVKHWYDLETKEESEDEWEDEEEKESEEGSEEENNDKVKVVKLDLEPDYIQIAKYIRDEDVNDNKAKSYREIYTSKVWQVLPYLQQLQTIRVLKNDVKEETQVVTYSRNGLEKFLRKN